MAEISNSNLLSELQNLTPEEIDRLRLKLWKRFGEQLRKIPDAPEPDDLLHEAIEDLLADRRHCPLNVNLSICLFHIVRSKVSHIYEKHKKEGMIKLSDEVLRTVGVEEIYEPELQRTILKLVENDSLLTRIVAYRLDHSDEEPIRARNIAEILRVNLRDVYNANRRLRIRLEKLIRKNS